MGLAGVYAPGCPRPLLGGGGGALHRCRLDGFRLRHGLRGPDRLVAEAPIADGRRSQRCSHAGYIRVLPHAPKFPFLHRNMPRAREEVNTLSACRYNHYVEVVSESLQARRVSSVRMAE